MHATDHPRPDPRAWRNDAACRGMEACLIARHGLYVGEG